MRKRNDKPMQKVTMNLFEGDMEKLRSFYPDIGASAVIRRLVEKYIEKIEAKGSSIEDLDIEVSI